MFKWLVEWWNNNKNVVKGFVIPKLDAAKAPFASFLVSKGMSAELAKIEAEKTIEWIKTYLMRQV